MKEYAYIATYAGFILAFIGIFLTWRQALKAKKAAESAQEAADYTKNEIYRILSVIDVSECKILVNQARQTIESGSKEVALYAIRNLTSSFNQLKEHSLFKVGSETRSNLDKLIYRCTDLEKDLSKDEMQLDLQKANSIMCDLEEFIDSLIGKSKYR